MDNSIHQLEKFSVWKRQFGIRSLGGNKMFTKGSNNDRTYSRRASTGIQTGKFASLVSLVKKLDGEPRSSIRTEDLEKAIRYTRPVDMGTIIRHR